MPVKGWQDICCLKEHQIMEGREASSADLLPKVGGISFLSHAASAGVTGRDSTRARVAAPDLKAGDTAGQVALLAYTNSQLESVRVRLEEIRSPEGWRPAPAYCLLGGHCSN